MMRRTPMSRGSGFKQKARARPERAQEEAIDDSPRPTPVPVCRGTYAALAPASAAPKSPRGENRLLLDMAKGEPCLLQTRICNNNPETTVACHPRGVAGEGTGGHYKASDERVIYGCSDCNHFTDAFGGATAEEKAVAFIMARPRQIERWKEIAATDRKEPRRRAALWALQRLGEA